MKAVIEPIDFKTFKLILGETKDVFRCGFDACKKYEVESRDKWIQNKVETDFFNRDRKHWTSVALGEKSDSFEYYHWKYKFKHDSHDWYKDNLEKVEELIKNFNLHIRLPVKEFILSDGELSLLTTSLNSA